MLYWLQHRMDTRQFEYILAVAEESYISKAAERLCISQPTLSQFVSRLERELGVSLFRRTRNGFMPTPEGEIVIDGARKIVAMKNEIMEKIAPFAESKQNRIIVGLTPGRSVELFSSFMPEFCRAEPNIEVQIIEAPITNIEELIRHGYIDLALISLGSDDEQLTGESFGSEEILFTVNREHPLARRRGENGNDPPRSIVPSEIARETFILSKKGYRLRAVVDAYLERFGIAPAIRMESPEIPLSCNMIRHGLGVGFTPAPFAERNTDLVFFRLEPPLHWDFGAVYRKNLRLSDQARRFIDIAKARSSSRRKEQAVIY